MPTLTLTGRPPGRTVYGNLHSDAGDPPATTWNPLAGNWVGYSFGTAYKDGSFPFTEGPAGTYTAVLESVLPNFAALALGNYFWSAHEQKGAQPDPTADAAYRWKFAEPVTAGANQQPPLSVGLTWGLPAPAGQDVRLAAGEDVRLAFAASAGTSPAGVGAAITFTARHPLTGAAALTVAAAGLDATAGTFVADLAAAATALLDPLLTYRWDAYRTDAGAVARLAHGRLLVAASQR